MNGIKTNINHDEEEEKDEEHYEMKLPWEQEAEELSIDDLMERLEEPMTLDKAEDRLFRMANKNMTTLYTFSRKDVHAIFNVLLNFVANQLDQ